MDEILKKYANESKEIILKFATNWGECYKALVIQRYSDFGCEAFKSDRSGPELQEFAKDVLGYAVGLTNTNIPANDLISLYYDLLNSPNMALYENGAYCTESFNFEEFENERSLFLDAINMPNDNGAEKKSASIARYLNYIYPGPMTSLYENELKHGFGENRIIGDLFFNVELKAAVSLIETSGLVLEQSNVLAFVNRLGIRENENLKILDLFENICGGFARDGNVLMKTMIDKKNDKVVSWLIKKGLPPKIQISKLIPGVPWRPRVSENKEVYFFDYAIAGNKVKLAASTMALLRNDKERHMLSQLVEQPRADIKAKAQAL